MTSDVAAPPSRRWILRIGAIWVLVGVAGGCLAAAIIANATCGNPTSAGNGGTPSGYCRAADLPGYPDDLSSALVFLALFLTPVLVAAMGLLVARAMSSPRAESIARWLALGALLAMWILVPILARVDVVGGG